jgi:hypothetical protein
MHLGIKTLIVLGLTSVSPITRAAYDHIASIACPTGMTSPSLRIDGIAYSNTEARPLVHFQGLEWAFLSATTSGSTWDPGVSHPSGRRLLTVALTAYKTGAAVGVRCNGSQDVSGLWIR